jgi:hypothetical protein
MQVDYAKNYGFLVVGYKSCQVVVSAIRGLCENQ